LLRLLLQTLTISWVGVFMQHSSGVLRAKKLRTNMSEPEAIFWSAVRNNKLGHQFRRQHKIGPYYADFVCIEKRLIIELDGLQHGTEPAVKYDNARTDFIKSRAWNIVRIPNGYIRKDLTNVLFCLRGLLDGITTIDEINIFFEKYNEPPPRRA
jgi:very-short-patch-repair endonuclease